MKPLAFLLLATLITTTHAASPPAPLAPLPSARQLQWQQNNFGLYFRLGLNTFTPDEQPTGKEDPTLFNPAKLDTRQWITLAKQNGATHLVLTAKGHEGFCLWPTQTTDYSVKKSPWKNGTGDVLKEFTNACHEASIPCGLQLSVTDLHNPSFGTPAYNALYLAQLRELLTNYGPLDEIRFDNAGGEGAKALPELAHDPRLDPFDWSACFALVRQLQPNAIIVSNIGPDARWNGNNIGHCGEPNWSPFDPGPSPIVTDKKELSHLNGGDEAGKIWAPAECLVPMRTTWFWHEGPPTFVATDRLFSAFCKSTGRNCSLLFNIPIDSDGLISAADAKTLNDVHTQIAASFDTDLAAGKQITASNTRGNDPQFAPANVLDNNPATYWAADDAVTAGCSLEIDLGKPTQLAIVRLAEEISLGQRVESYRLEVPDGETWKTVAKGKSIGISKIERLPPTLASKIRLVIEKARAAPTIAAFSLFGKQ